MGIKGFGREMRRREGEESGRECEVGEGRGALCSILLMFTGQYQKSRSSCETSRAVVKCLLPRLPMNKRFTELDELLWGLQIASAMDFLASKEVRQGQRSSHMRPLL